MAQQDTQKDTKTKTTTVGSWTILYDGQFVHMITDPAALDNVTNRSTYFRALVERWSDHDDDDDRTHSILPLASVGPMAVSFVLATLDKTMPLVSLVMVDALEEDRRKHSRRQDNMTVPIPEQIIRTSFYLGCDDDVILSWYCAAAKPRDKRRVALSLCQQEQQGSHPKEVERLLSMPHFWDGLDKPNIPLCEDCCVSLPVAVLLLRAHRKAPERGLVTGLTEGLWGSVQRLWARNENTTASGRVAAQQTLDVGAFGLRTVQKFVAEPWSVRDLEVVFAVLPSTHEPYSKPSGLEDFLITAIRMQMEIPPVLRHWDDVDVTLIGPVLWETDRLNQANDWPHPDLLVRTVTHGWTARDCLVALEEDQGGIRRLFEMAVQSHQCDWLATLAIFAETCRIAPPLGRVQRLLYLLLSLHMDFDARLPPALLCEVPYETSLRYRDRVLEHAVRYLEDGQIRDVEAMFDFPWKDASRIQTEGAAEALRYEQGSVIWSRLDIAKLRVVGI